MKRIYYGCWSANNGSNWGEGYEFTNLRTALKVIKAIALGNTFEGNIGQWSVWDDNRGGKDWGIIGCVKG